MRLYKYSAFLLAALGCGMAWAAVNGADTGRSEEKVRPSEGLMSVRPASASHYVKVKAEGAADGVPYGLRTTDVSEKTVRLTWLSPEPVDGYFDDFEDHDNFAVNSSGSVGWSYLDGDNVNTYTWSACTFPNQGQKMAFIVMNPWKTSPAVNENPDFQPYSGEKMLVDFCAVDAQNNDFIISPELSFERDFQFSFMARTYKYADKYPLERIRVGYSTTGRRPSDFTWVTADPYEEVPARWTRFQYTIPKEAKYVTLNCVSNDAFMLMVDDIFVGTNEVRPAVAPKAAAANPLVGYNVYRDGTKLNAEPLDSIRYTDTVDEYGDYTYAVTAVYKDGTESAKSEPLAVNVPDVRLLPFEDGFDDWTLNADKWSRTQQDGTDADQNHWSVDYYEYGLIDPCATYTYSSLANYDQSLVTRELHTTSQADTYLRFRLKLRNSEFHDVDYLSAEVSSDDGATWKTVHTFDNSNGAFEWTTYQFPLADYLSSDLFRVRFRAHGLSASWINYWYVDDVKVWTPVWTSGTLTVRTADGPVADCPVTLTADHGAVVSDTTDADGRITLSEVEAGTYTVAVAKDGYSVYKQEWTLSEGQSNTFVATLTRPAVSLSTLSVVSDMAAEDSVGTVFTLRNTGDGPMTWSLRQQPTKATGDITHRWEQQGSLKASGDLQQSVAFDGEYYYTSSSIELGKFWKYDRQGNLIEQFSIPEMYYKLYDLTYDGRYFYGSDYSNRLFKLDFDNRRVAGIITVSELPDLQITHCSWDPDRKVFWVGSFNNIVSIRPTGKMSSQLVTFDSNTTLSVYGSAYDNVTPGGPYLWLADMTAVDDNTIDKLQLRQYSLTSRKLTGEGHVLDDAEGYIMGSSTTGSNYVCGIFASPDITPGKLTLVGSLNQSPNLFFRYTLCDTDPWLTFSPRHGQLEAGAEQQISVGFNALQAKQGDTFTTQALLMTNPETTDQTIGFTLNATSAAARPRPVSLTATPGKASVALAWEPGASATAPKGYNVYRDGVKITSSPVTETAYTDARMVYGHYAYKVSAVYADGKESAQSEAVEAFVKDGAQYYAPLGLGATLSHNKNVALTWSSPSSGAGLPDTLSWASGVHEDQIGLSGGGLFYVGCEWDADDIVPYRGKKVTSVSVQMVNPCTYLALRIYKDGEMVYRKTYTGDIVYDGSFTDIPVETPVTLEPGCVYRFVLQLMNDDGVQPISIDDQKAVNGKGNLISTNGTDWRTAAQMGIEGNFNIRVGVEPGDASAEEEPAGYNVYRDGTKVNSAPVTAMTYADVVTVPGDHDYAVSSVYADGGESKTCSATTVHIVAIGDPTAPKELSAHVERNRQVSLRWGLPVADATFKTDLTQTVVTTEDGYPEYVRSFRGMPSEMAIATDGKYIYTSVYNEDGLINKYSLDGTYQGGFKLDGLDGVRNIAYDGTCLYVGDNTTDIHKVDPESMSVVETIPVSEYSRHIAYVPELDGGKGGFEVGDWETSIFVGKNGSKLATGPTLLGASGTACYDGRLYAFEQGNKANAYTVGIYDMATSERVGSIDMGKYLELSDISSATAGGMSSYTSADGVTYLLMALQRKGENTQFVILDLSGLQTVEGYNVYRDGTKLNEQPLVRRHFTETLSQPGTYRYTVQTVYVDGTLSAVSEEVPVTIVEAGEAKTPVEVRAVQSTYGYNVLLSFADPDMHEGAARTDNYDDATVGTELYGVDGATYASHWTVSDDVAFSGTKSLLAAKKEAAFGVLSEATGMTTLRLAARNADDHEGNGTLSVYYTQGGTLRDNFIFLTSLTTSEAWQDYTVTLPEGTEYVAIAKADGSPATYVDDVALYAAEPESQVYGYDIFRNGEKLNADPVSGISYVDRNLLPGTYTYQVRLITKTSAESALSDPVSIDLSYDNGGLAPTNLRATAQADGSTHLTWQYPALGEPIYLRWHDGYSYDAAGLPNGGAFFAGVRWYASDLKGYDHLALSDVEVYINQVPEACFLLVYENNELVRQQYVPTLSQYAFNTIHLEQPLPVDATKDLRVAVYVEHNSVTIPLGYDKGPAKAGRGNLYSTDGTSWITMDDSSVNIDGNWNISIGLSPYSNTLPGETSKTTLSFAPRTLSVRQRLAAAPAKASAASEKNVFQGYYVYRNGERLNDVLTTDTAYVDDDQTSDRYREYKVSAVYTVSGEQFSNKVLIVASGIGSVESDGIVISSDHGTLRVRGAHAGDTLTVYAASGAMVYSTTVGDDYETAVPAGHLLRGTYLVRIGKTTFKVVL